MRTLIATIALLGQGALAASNPVEGAFKATAGYRQFRSSLARGCEPRITSLQVNFIQGNRGGTKTYLIMATNAGCADSVLGMKRHLALMEESWASGEKTSIKERKSDLVSDLEAALVEPQPHVETPDRSVEQAECYARVVPTYLTQLQKVLKLKVYSVKVVRTESQGDGAENSQQVFYVQADVAEWTAGPLSSRLAFSLDGCDFEEFRLHYR